MAANDDLREAAREQADDISSRFVVVDSDCFVHLSRGKARAAVLAPYVEGRRMVLSFATVAEVRRGAYRRDYNEESWRRLEADITAAVVVAPTNALSHEWARLTNQARSMGHALGQGSQAHDAWVAATGRHYGLPILTDDKDFEGFPDLVLLPERE
jgi:tRNA(fMet)-specific endonuclease VapC